MAIIEARALAKTFIFRKKQPGLAGSLRSVVRPERTEAHAVRGVNFRIEPGEFVGFLGPNGAGKTTTLKMLSGIITPTAGEVRVLGYYPHERKRAFQRRFALVMGQKNQLWWDLPARESFDLNAALYRIPAETYKKVHDELVDLLGIGHILDKPVRQLSLGERMKAELVAALLHQPELIMLDEPTIGLDVVAQKNIRDFLREYNAKHGRTVILTSHYMDDIEALAKRVIIINQGLLLFDGSLLGLQKKFAADKFLEVILEKPVSEKLMAAYGRVTDFSDERVMLRVHQDKIRRVAADVLSSDLPVKDINIRNVTLEEIIHELFVSQKNT